ETSGATLGADRIQLARAATQALGTFTVAELAAELEVSVHVARRRIAALSAQQAVAAAGSAADPHSPGRRRRLYRLESGAGDAESPRDGSRRISAKTINNSLIPLRLSLSHAVEDGLIGRNPAASVAGARRRVKVAVEQREMDFLRLDEIPRYLEACAGHYRPLAEVLIATGLRISEALHLRWSDVDLEGHALLVTGSRKRGRERETSGSTKGDRWRSVDFGPRTAGLLRDLRATQSEHQFADFRSRPVFVHHDGGRLSRNTVSTGWHKAALEDAELRTTLRLHDLRHSAAASWLAAGLPLIYVQRQLGHASITTTEAQYGHLEKSFLRGAAQRAEAVLWEGRVEVPAAAFA
ncbi:MAG: site-specific integrase, partial [Actinomycetota bacterium]|nr:site-specific integrase [Actinomycetota bacterium]